MSENQAKNQTVATMQEYPAEPTDSSVVAAPAGADSATVESPAAIRPLIIIATHKQYDFCKDALYVPVQAGAALRAAAAAAATAPAGGLNASPLNPAGSGEQLTSIKSDAAAGLQTLVSATSDSDMKDLQSGPAGSCLNTQPVNPASPGEQLTSIKSDVPAGLIPGTIPDNTGDNISLKNKSFCELTALYWLWKNSSLFDATHLGLCHYRRYFKSPSHGSHQSTQSSCNAAAGEQSHGPLAMRQARQLLAQKPVILPKPRNYFIETNYSQYAHAHHEEDLIKTKEILQERFPDYIPAWNSCMKRTVGHRFNMLIMEKSLFNSYCSWLFDILFELERRLDISAYSDYDKRVFGFVSERLLDIWIETNNIEYTELPVLETEPVNWPEKIIKFIARKIKGHS